MIRMAFERQILSSSSYLHGAKPWGTCNVCGGWNRGVESRGQLGLERGRKPQEELGLVLTREAGHCMPCCCPAYRGTR